MEAIWTACWRSPMLIESSVRATKQYDFRLIFKDQYPQSVLEPRKCKHGFYNTCIYYWPFTYTPVPSLFCQWLVHWLTNTNNLTVLKRQKLNWLSPALFLQLGDNEVYRLCRQRMGSKYQTVTSVVLHTVLLYSLLSFRVWDRLKVNIITSKQ